MLQKTTAHYGERAGKNGRDRGEGGAPGPRLALELQGTERENASLWGFLPCLQNGGREETAVEQARGELMVYLGSNEN